MTKEEFIKSITLEGEEWRDVVGYEGYYKVSNLGRIASIREFYEYTRNGKTFIRNCTKHICSTSIAPSTHYERMTFKVNYKHDTQLVHRIVAKAFIPNPHGYTCIDHIDDNPKNNHADNLQWCDYKINNSKPHHKLASSVAKIGNIDPKRKPIIAYKEGVPYKIYPSVWDAQYDGHKNSAIIRVLQGKLKTHHGLYWEYLPTNHPLYQQVKEQLPHSLNPNNFHHIPKD